MKNKVWLSLLILPFLTGCGETTTVPVKPTPPVKVQTVQEQNAEILKNVKIDIPVVKSGEYKNVDESGNTYSDPNRIQLGDREDDFLDQIQIEVK